MPVKNLTVSEDNSHLGTKEEMKVTLREEVKNAYEEFNRVRGQ